MKKSFLPIITFAKIDIKRLFRDKMAIFFTFIFPLIFLLIFGAIYNNNNNLSFSVALLSSADNQFSQNFTEQLKSNEIFNIKEDINTLDIANERLNRGSIDAVIVLPSDFGQVGNAGYPAGQAKVLYNQSNEQAGQALTSILETIFNNVNKQFVTTSTPFTVKGESTATQGLSAFDYIFAGLLGFTLLSLGVYGPTTVFPRLKQRGVIRRYHTTTLKVWQYFTGNVLSNVFVGTLAVSIMLAVAILLFDLSMKGNYLSLLAVVILGAILMYGIGLAIGGWAKNENQASPMSQLVALPMMFLSGVFFPTFLMPQFLQNITQFLPLTPIVDSFRLIITEGMSLIDLKVEIAIMLAWLVVIYILAFKFFRWE